MLVVLACTVAGCDWSFWDDDDDDDDSSAVAEEAAVWTDVSAGDVHVAALKSDGTLWTWGGNAEGQLGLDTWANKALPEQVGTDTWTEVSAGDSHTFALNTNERPYSWGYAAYGQLGDDRRVLRTNVPAQTTYDADWSAVSAGRLHTLVLKENGTIWICGLKMLNPDSTGDISYSLAQVGTDTDWAAVEAGGIHNLALKTSGTLWAWGQNDSGQLGIGTTDSQGLPVQVGSKSDWTAAFSAGEGHSLAIRSDGSLWAWGRNDHGQLGDGTNEDRSEPVQVDGAGTWKAVSAGVHHSLAIREDGTLWAWGLGADGRLGNGSTESSSVPVQVGMDADWTVVSAGLGFSVAIRSDGSLWAWGANDRGQLGNGTSEASSVPVPVGGQ
jgi:alpha-tubulin suppressor-like RCC1 family protein